MTTSGAIPISCLVLTAVIFLWSGISPYDRATWWLEISPVLAALPVLAATYKNFRLTNLVYILIFVHAVILMVGGHYTYARVPLFDWLGHDRNNYDKIGHFAQGFIPTMVMRELLVRTSPLQPGKWMAAIIVFSCLGISAAYELIEWIVAIILDQGANEFLGSQGDVWDTQKDMLLALIGAVVAQVVLGKAHDRQMARVP